MMFDDWYWQKKLAVEYTSLVLGPDGLAIFAPLKALMTHPNKTFVGGAYAWIRSFIDVSDEDLVDDGMIVHH